MIHVYTPSFPEQIITTKPELIITLGRSRPGLTGYLDMSRPHAVNHLIVGDIGDEEVVVVACDDGDVISYTVRSISLAIDEKAETVFGHEPSRKQGITSTGLTGWTNMILPVVGPNECLGCRILAPWFHENVGASAWGLATHKQAMLLAVSSNSKDVHVFAPSLAVPKTNPGPQTLQRFTPWRNGSAIRDRTVGRIVTLQGHAANIPNIAFCDNTLDLGGMYLTSTDIDGHTIIWDIWRGARIIEIYQFQGACKPNGVPLLRLSLIVRSRSTRLGCYLLGPSSFETQVRCSGHSPSVEIFKTMSGEVPSAAAVLPC